VRFLTEHGGDADGNNAVYIASSKTTYSDDYGSRLIVLMLVIEQIFPGIRLTKFMSESDCIKWTFL
jgi:hypothetical protein